MSGPVKHPCQAIVVRYCPDPTSGELLNVGVVLISAGHRFMGARFLDSWSRVTQTFPEADRVQLRRIASAVERSCERHYSGKQLRLEEPTGAIDAAFDAAVPRMDASIMRSLPITGITANAERTLSELFERYVAVRDPAEKRIARDDNAVWRGVSEHLKAKNVLDRLQPRTIQGPHNFKVHFEHAWQNGHWNVARALSFDLLEADAIANKAANWSGRIFALASGRDVGVHLLVGMPPSDAPAEIRAAADDAVAILRDQLEPDDRAEIVPESEAGAFAERVAKDIEEHQAAE